MNYVGQIVNKVSMRSVFPLRKYYTEQMFVSVSMQLCNYADTQPVSVLSGAIRYMHNIKCRMLHLRDNEISLRK